MFARPLCAVRRLTLCLHQRTLQIGSEAVVIGHEHGQTILLDTVEALGRVQASLVENTVHNDRVQKKKK